MAAFDLTTAARVKEMLSTDFGSNTSSDAFLASTIGEVSSRVEAELGRAVDAAARTETYDVGSGQRTWQLTNYPVSVVSEVKFALNGDFASATAIDADRYQFEPTCGGLHFYANPPGVSPYRGDCYFQALSVTYTGGMAADTAAFMSAYPDLAGAVTRQVAHAFSRRDTPGKSAKGNSRAFSRGGEDPYALLSDLHAAIRRHSQVALA